VLVEVEVGIVFVEEVAVSVLVEADTMLVGMVALTASVLVEVGVVFTEAVAVSVLVEVDTMLVGVVAPLEVEAALVPVGVTAGGCSSLVSTSSGMIAALLYFLFG
jgi:hypothetical protein